MPHIIPPCDLIGADTVTDAEGSLVRKPADADRFSVQRAGHHDKAAVAALGSPVAESLVKIEEFIKLCSAHDIHNALVVGGAVLIKAIRAVFFQFVGQISACDKNDTPVQAFRRFADLESQPVMVRQRQSRQTDTDHLIS